MHYHETWMLAGLLSLLLVISSSATAKGVDREPLSKEEGVLWNVPDWAEPDMSLVHPRVFYTTEDVALARNNLSDAGPTWAKAILGSVLAQAESFPFSEEEIRNLTPGQYAYYMYTDTLRPCPDGSRMTPAGWESPGKVRCGSLLLPDEDHPDDGRGWTDEKGNTYYFVARWNGFVVTEFTNAVQPLAFAYNLSGDEKYARKVAAILDALATNYPTATIGPVDYPGLGPGKEGGRLERPEFQTARKLIQYVNAADLIWDSPVMDEQSPTNPELTVRDNIVYNMLINGADYCYRESKSLAKFLTNGVGEYNKGVLAVGSLLGIDTFINWAVGGPNSLEVMVSNNLDRDGLYFETTALYTNVARGLYQDLSEMTYNLKSATYPKGVNYYDRPRFAELYATARERMFVAGRGPQYGDTDPDGGTGGGDPYDGAAFGQLLRFFVRTDDPEKKATYGDLLQQISGGNPYKSLDEVWQIYNVSQLPTGEEVAERATRPSEVLGGKGIALLRSGDNRGAFIRYGATLSHGQADELGLIPYANNRELAFDPGYGSAHYREGWTHQTVSHLAVVVNEQSQITQQSSGGSLNYLAYAPGFSVVNASDESAYAGEDVDVYQRSVALVDTSEQDSYLVDIFRISGGQKRDYSFHSRGSFATEGLALSAPQPGSLASPEYTWHDKVGVDGKIKGYQNQSFYWNPPPGNGYGLLGNPQTASGEAEWSGMWSNLGTKLRLTMLPAAGRQVVVADGPTQMGSVKYVLARDEGEDPSQFISIIDAGKELQVTDIKELETSGGISRGFAPVALQLTLAQPDAATGEQVQDLILSTTDGTAFTATAAGAQIKTDAKYAMVRLVGGKVKSVHVIQGSYLEVGDFKLADFVSEMSGEILSVDYSKGSILVSADGAISPLLAGEEVLIEADEYSHNSPYQIERVEKEGENYRLYLYPKTFSLAKGKLEEAPVGNRLPNMVSLPYSRNLRSQGANRYFDGKRVTNGTGAETLITAVDDNYAGLVVGDATGFQIDDEIEIFDVKAGDAFRVPISVHMTQADAYSYQVKSPNPVLVAFPKKQGAYVYVTNTEGDLVEATPAGTGYQEYRLPPGRVVLQRAGLIEGAGIIKVNADSDQLPELTVRLREFGEMGLAIANATVTAEFAGKRLNFAEIEPGVYRSRIPQGTLVGDYEFRVSAEKEGIAIYPLDVRLAAIATWGIESSNVVEIPSGSPFELKAKIAGEKDCAEPYTMSVIMQGEEFPFSRSGDTFSVQLVGITDSQEAVLKAINAQGWAKRMTIRLWAAGGRIVPLQTEIKAKAGAAVKLQAKFVASDGSVLKGNEIPSAQAFLGFFAFADFTDEDGDGIAEATLQSPRLGTNTVSVWAEGYEEAEIKVVVSD